LTSIMSDKNKSAFVIAYVAVALSGAIIGFMIGVYFF